MDEEKKAIYLGDESNLTNKMLYLHFRSPKDIINQ